MNIKKQLGIGIGSLILGLMLIGGGTFAFFSDTEVSESTFSAGTLDLNMEPTELINIDNLKPGDSMIRDFELSNNGTLDIGKVTLDTEFNVIDANEDNTENFGEYIQVEFLYNVDNLDEVIYETSLADLKEMTPEAINQHVFYPVLGDVGLPTGQTHDLIVKFVFLENGEDQNQFQGDSLELEWTFIAHQTEGEQK